MYTFASNLSGSSSPAAAATGGDSTRIPDPPAELSSLENSDLETFWYLSKFVRDTLSDQECLDKIREKSIVPFFCMFNNGCKQFASEEKLEKHFGKNESHRPNISELTQQAKEIKVKNSQAAEKKKSQSAATPSSLARRLGFSRSPSNSSTASGSMTRVGPPSSNSRFSRSPDRNVRGGSVRPRSRSPRSRSPGEGGRRRRSVSPQHKRFRPASEDQHHNGRRRFDGGNSHSPSSSLLDHSLI